MAPSRPQASTPGSPESGLDPRFYGLFLAFNRRLLAILRHLRPPLSTNESHILAAVGDRPGVAARELVEMLGIEKSSISRVLRELIERELVREAPDEADRRRKSLLITPLGAGVLVQDSRVRNRELELALEPLPGAAHRELQRFLARMADALGEPAVDPRSDDHPIKREVRRLTRAMGFIGASCMGTGLPVDECQVLHLLTGRPAGMAMAELVRRLPYEVSGVSRLISGLEGRGLVEKRRSGQDHRALDVVLTAGGSLVAGMNEETGERFVRGALPEATPAEVERFGELLAGFVHEEFTPGGGGDGQLEVRRALGEQERQEARAFLVEHVVRLGRHHHLPERLLAADSTVGVATVRGVITGVVEARIDGGQGRVVHLVWSETAAEVRETIAALVVFLLAAGRFEEVALPHGAIEGALLRRLFPELRGRSTPLLNRADLLWLRGPSAGAYGSG